MHYIATFFGLVKQLYSFPLHIYKSDQGDCGYYDFDGLYHACSPQRDWALTLGFGAAIYGITLVVAGFIVWWLIDKLIYLSKRQRCQHDECEHQWTVDVQEELRSDCRQGDACCGFCQERHIDDDIERQAEHEPKLSFPGCHATMAKVIEYRIIQDVCNSCGGVFLSNEEKVALNEVFYDGGYESGYDNGQSAGRSSGIAIGMMIG